MIFSSDVVAATLSAYNEERANCGQPPVDAISRQVKIAVEQVLLAVEHELALNGVTINVKIDR